MSDISQPRARSQTNPFYRIPLTMIEEILMKLKAKYISKLIIISKSWSSIVRNKYFTNAYLTQSLTRPHILFSIEWRVPIFSIELQEDVKQLFYSCSQEDPSSDHERVRFYPPNLAKRYYFSPPVRGLICGLNDSKNEVIIGNPSTGQTVTLPKVITQRKDILFFFGYDHVADVYKVLCMTVSRHNRASGGVVSEEHQVFTLGAIRKKWRKIECKHLHFTPPGTKGICSNGVVYYLAPETQETPVLSLICFDVGSEEFSVIKLPRDVRLLSNYGEKIAVTNMLSESTLDLWVLEDASKQVWSKVSILVPSWTSLYMDRSFVCRGTLGTGELIFAPFVSSPNPYYLLCYDLKENKARRIEIQGIENNYWTIQVFLDHVESPMILQQ